MTDTSKCDDETACRDGHFVGAAGNVATGSSRAELDVPLADRQHMVRSPFLQMATYRVFFSHGGDDTFIVQNFLKPRLEGSGASVFLDAGQLQYGDDFRDTILDELGQCDELVVLFTPSALKRPWVFAEVGATLIGNKRLVAIIYGTNEEELLALGVLSLVGTTKFMKMDDFDTYVEQLGKRVRANT